MRGTLAVALVAQAALFASAASAGPLDPPSHSLTVALVEPTKANPAALNLTLAITATEDHGAVAIVGFEPKGKKRLLHDAVGSAYIEARHGGVYPSVAVNGSEQLPPCPAEILCAIPRLPSQVEQSYDATTYTFKPTNKKLHFYVFVNDADAKLTPSSGWRVRYVKGGSLLQFRDTGTEARVSVEDRQYMVEDFHGVTAPRVNGPSFAFASIPCWPAPAPGGIGQAVLRNDGRAPSIFRDMNCATHTWGAIGASDTPTVWKNDGASLGWSGGGVNRLVVAVLPPA